MGLGGYTRTWQRQIKDFGHVEADKYTCLFCDNRGMGQSDKPLLRYTTSEMAKDIIELLDHLDWKQERDLHIVGISMGGMIAQELVRCPPSNHYNHQLTLLQALLIPERICSLNLISTAPRIVRTLPFFENLKNRAQLMMPKTPDNQIAKVKADCYSAEWLTKPDELEYVVEPFPTNGDRFAAQELRKRTTPGLFTTTGFICQLYAAGFHHKSAKQLKQIGDKVGRNRILVFHGTDDNSKFAPVSLFMLQRHVQAAFLLALQLDLEEMSTDHSFLVVNFVHGKMLLEELGGEESGITKSFHEGLGHIGPMEMRKQFHDIIAGRIQTTEVLGRN